MTLRAAGTSCRQAPGPTRDAYDAIVKNPRDLAMMSENEKARTKDSKKAFSEEELNRYLNELPGSQPQAAPVPDAAPRSSSSKSTPPPQTGRMVR